MADEQRPFRLGPPPTPRDPAGKFASKNLPDNPVEQVEDGQKATKWAPMIGQGTARTFGQRDPWPKIAPTATVSSPPMKNLSSGRR